MARKALIVVDVQRDFCPGGSLAVPNGDEVVAPLNQMEEFCFKNRWLTVTSCDWHPGNSKHFSEFGGRWPVHCVAGTEGAKFHPDLNYEGAVIIVKGVDCEDDGGYSAFEGMTLAGRPLLAVLEGVEEVYVGGLATDYCVQATALDAIKNGFKTFLLLDACRAVDLNPGDGEKAIAEMRQAGVMVITTGEVLRGAN